MLLFLCMRACARCAYAWGFSIACECVFMRWCVGVCVCECFVSFRFNTEFILYKIEISQLWWLTLHGCCVAAMCHSCIELLQLNRNELNHIHIILLPFECARNIQSVYRNHLNVIFSATTTTTTYVPTRANRVYFSTPWITFFDRSIHSIVVVVVGNFTLNSDSECFFSINVFFCCCLLWLAEHIQLTISTLVLLDLNSIELKQTKNVKMNGRISERNTLLHTSPHRHVIRMRAGRNTVLHANTHPHRIDPLFALHFVAHVHTRARHRQKTYSFKYIYMYRRKHILQEREKKENFQIFLFVFVCVWKTKWNVCLFVFCFAKNFARIIYIYRYRYNKTNSISFPQ